MVVIYADSRRRDGEAVGGPSVVIGIERHDELLGAAFAVSSRHKRPNGARMAAVHPRADVHRVVVVDDPDLGALRGGPPPRGPTLDERPRRPDLAPDRLP